MREIWILTDVNFRVMTFSGAFLVQRQFLSGASKDISLGQDYLEEKREEVKIKNNIRFPVSMQWPLAKLYS